MLILIAGATGVGKSSLAQTLGVRFAPSRTINTSDIREALRSVLNSRSHPDLFTSSYCCDGVLEAEMIRHFQSQASLIHLPVAQIMRRANDPGRLQIVEGVHVLPELARMLDNLAPEVILMQQPSVMRHMKQMQERGQLLRAKSWSRYVDSFESIRAIGSYIERSWCASGATVNPVASIEGGVAAAQRLLDGKIRPSVDDRSTESS